MTTDLDKSFREILLGNPVNRAILERLPGLGVSDAWLVSGCLFQTVWNHLTGRTIDHGIKDYDVFYFDATDVSYDAEDVVIKRCEIVFSDLDAEIEIRNQARVHLWYEDRFELPYPPLRSSREGIDRFLEQTSMIGLRPTPDGAFDIYAPNGLARVFDMVVTPNRGAPHFSAERYREKVDRWRACWPEITVRI
ncbi:MAG: nucleotidyltransferase family protein [Rhodospirillales bacterium]